MPKPEEYLLRQFAGEYHLIPYGQKAADRKPTLSINESGALLWEALLRGESKEKMCGILLDHYQGQDIRHLDEDVEDFLAWLELQGVTKPKPDTKKISSSSRIAEEHRFFQIGNLNLEAWGETDYLYGFFKEFETERPRKIDQSIEIQAGKRPNPLFGQRIRLHTNELMICEEEDYFVFLYLPMPHLVEGQVKKDGSSASFFITGHRETQREKTKDALFHAMRFSYLVLAQRRGIFALHSASVLYKEKAWLFSAPSGTGKTTHAEFWRELFHVPILNGDLNLLTLEKGIPVVHGLPWCGTSETYTPKSYPLGGIVFLKQAEENEVAPLSEAEQELSLYKRLISPSWTKEQLVLSLDFCRDLARSSPVFSLHCNKSSDAVVLMKEAIDEVTSCFQGFRN